MQKHSTVFWNVEVTAVPVYIIKAYEEAMVQLHSFLISALDGMSG
jgi:hypothetical protein